MRIRKALLITPDRCIACRSCQVSCKEWNELPAEPSVNLGSYENPGDVGPNLYNRIRFIERTGPDGLEWHFLNERCLHCGDAACVKVCPSGALRYTAFDTVAVDKSKCVACHYCISACPFEMPRYDAQGKISKCHLCSDRITNGLEPACAKSCPTGAIRYGDRDALLAEARHEGRTAYGEMDLGGTGVIYALSRDPEIYGLPAKPMIPLPITLWRDIIRPLGWVGFWGALGFAFLHYVTFGPKKLEMYDRTDETEERTGGD